MALFGPRLSVCPNSGSQGQVEKWEGMFAIFVVTYDRNKFLFNFTTFKKKSLMETLIHSYNAIQIHFLVTLYFKVSLFQCRDVGI